MFELNLNPLRNSSLRLRIFPNNPINDFKINNVSILAMFVAHCEIHLSYNLSNSFFGMKTVRNICDVLKRRVHYKSTIKTQIKLIEHHPTPRTDDLFVPCEACC